MEYGTENGLLWRGMAVLLVILPIVGGGLLFLLFESNRIHRLGVFLIVAGVLVGGALFLLRTE